MGRPFRVLLSGSKVYACAACRTHLSSGDQLVSRHFHSKTGRAYLFQSVCNVSGGPHETRMMTTGRHIVCDIFCVECMACVGWQYVFAYEESQKYKEGMSILERALVVDFEKSSPAALAARAAHVAPPGMMGVAGAGGGGAVGVYGVVTGGGSSGGSSVDSMPAAPHVLMAATAPILMYPDDSCSEEDDPEEYE